MFSLGQARQIGDNKDDARNDRKAQNAADRAKGPGGNPITAFLNPSVGGDDKLLGLFLGFQLLRVWFYVHLWGCLLGLFSGSFLESSQGFLPFPDLLGRCLTRFRDRFFRRGSRGSHSPLLIQCQGDDPFLQGTAFGRGSFADADYFIDMPATRAGLQYVFVFFSTVFAIDPCHVTNSVSANGCSLCTAGRYGPIPVLFVLYHIFCRFPEQKRISGKIVSGTMAVGTGTKRPGSNPDESKNRSISQAPHRTPGGQICPPGTIHLTQRQAWFRCFESS